MINIEIWSDINCPFCYIGKRHLESAIKGLNLTDVSIEWKSFELEPHAKPPKDSSQEELLAKKYGKDLAWARDMNNNMTDMARAAGLDFHMSNVVPANSFNAHRLIHLAKSYNKQDAMKERLLKARYTEGKDIGDVEVLKMVGRELDLDVDNLFASDKYADDVRHDELMASELGIRGVPFFVFNKKFTLSGARPVEAFQEILEKLH